MNILFKTAGNSTALAALFALLLTSCASGPSSRSALAWTDTEQSGLSAWVEDDLQPYLREKLTLHPRFKGETVSVVSMAGDRVRTDANNLSVELVRRLNNILLATDGVKLVWDRDIAAAECRPREAAHYYIGVEVSEARGSGHRVTVRALDREDSAWVSGFGREWQGRLTRDQLAAYKGPKSDGQPGERRYPFQMSETDLLAAKLAASLNEKLCGFADRPVAIYVDSATDDSRFVGKTLALVSNNLATSTAISIVADPGSASLTLSARMYPIDGSLNQFWILARSAAPGPALPVADVSAYVNIAGDRSATRPAAEAEVARAKVGAILSSFRVITPSRKTLCRSSDPWRQGAHVMASGERVPNGGCFALEIDARSDTKLFLISPATDSDHRRFAAGWCPRYNHVSTSLLQGETFRYSGRRHVIAGHRKAGDTIFFAVAVTDPGAARRFEHRLTELSASCQSARDPQLARVLLSGWVDELGARADWQSVRVRQAL